jgi:Family of unknown function (DUF6152)
MRLKLLCFATFCLLASALTSIAHHSHGNYDVSKWVPVEGTVKEVHWINPHSWIYLEVKDATGKALLWSLEAADPPAIQRNGIKREDVKPGDPIKVRCHRLRDGSNGCLLGFVTPMHGDAARGHGIEKEWD